MSLPRAVTPSSFAIICLVLLFATVSGARQNLGLAFQRAQEGRRQPRQLSDRSSLADFSGGAPKRSTWNRAIAYWFNASKTQVKPDKGVEAAEERNATGAWGRFVRNYITFRFILRNVLRNRLEDHAKLRILLQEAVQQAITLRVDGSHAQVAFDDQDWRVALRCQVAVPSYADVREVELRFHRNETFRQAVMVAISALPGISELSTGPIVSDGVQDLEVGYMPPFPNQHNFTRYWWIRVLNFEVVLVGIALLSLLCRYTMPITIDQDQHPHEDTHADYERVLAVTGGHVRHS